jgi:hypothetical protein
MCSKFWLESLKQRDHADDLGIGGRITLKWIRKQDVDLTHDAG